MWFIFDSKIVPYLFEFKKRIAIAMLCLILTKVASVYLPFILKDIVDTLDANTSDSMQPLLVPFGLVIAYGLVRLSIVFFAEVRDTLFGRVTERAIRRIGLKVFRHLHALDLDFHLKLDNDEINSGSHGQTYTANALLCLARLSLIEEKDVGLKIMPIDEAEGLGSNYDMLHELAEEEKYQIVTMAIETAGEITNDGQYIYIMNENNLADMENFVPPLGIFSDEVFEDINEYINGISKK